VLSLLLVCPIHVYSCLIILVFFFFCFHVLIFHYFFFLVSTLFSLSCLPCRPMQWPGLVLFCYRYYFILIVSFVHLLCIFVFHLWFVFLRGTLAVWPFWFLFSYFFLNKTFEHFCAFSFWANLFLYASGRSAYRYVWYRNLFATQSVFNLQDLVFELSMLRCWTSMSHYYDKQPLMMAFEAKWTKTEQPCEKPSSLHLC